VSDEDKKPPLPSLEDRKAILESRLSNVKAQLLDVQTAKDNLTNARGQYEGALAVLNELIAVRVSDA